MEFSFASPARYSQYIINPDKDETIVKRTENFDGLLDVTSAIRNAESSVSRSGDTKLLGMVPGIVIEHYCTVKGITWAEFWRDQKWIKALLNDPEFAYFKTTAGRI